MFKSIKVLSTQRGIWFLVVFSAICLELTALYFQHGMGLRPCVMCIYERVALFGVAFAGLWGMLAPRFWIMRLSALGFGLWGAIQGLILAYAHVGYQLDPKPWDQCPITTNFPSTLPLDQWLPSVFKATGVCSEISWRFLGFTMVQWLVFIFAVYVVFFALILLSQLLGGKIDAQRDLFR